MTVLQIVLTSVISLIILFILTKLMGNKQVSQLNMFDYIIGITIGSIAAELATDLEDPVQPVTAMIVYGLVAVLISWLTTKSNMLRGFFTGKPIILMDRGKLSKQKLKQAKLDVNEFLAMARVAGFFDISQIETAVLEHNGNASFLAKTQYRPANPDDMKLPVQPEELPLNVIVDGCVMEEELRRAGMDAQWLRGQLKDNGYSSEKEVFLGTLAPNGTVHFFKMDA